MTRIELTKYAEIIKNKTNIDVKNLFEIGSRHGKDADWLSKQFNIQPSNVYIFEAHSVFFSEIKEKYKDINVYHKAVFSENGEIEFNEALAADDGRSSVMQRDIYGNNFTKKTVECKRMDTIMQEMNIEKIDMLKLDVEGAAYEVLQGFGKRISDLKSIQIESEQYQVWEHQKTWEDIQQFMIKNNFICLWDIKVGSTQNDSVWVQKEYVL